jgi:glycosyltransferase involved in cell wall biosynthesis
MRRVDVVIPCYNYGRYLSGCVASVLSQDGVDVRVLILDDASDDDTPVVARALAAEDPRVEFRRHPSNAGHIRTYNEGLQWADGDFTLLLSADDLLTPGALARASRLMEDHPEVVLTYGGIIRLFDDEMPAAPQPPPPEPGWRVIGGRDFVEDACASAENPICTPTAVVRTEVQKQIGGYREELPHSGDLEMWLRFAARGAVGYLDAEQAYYRRHRRSMRFQYCGARNFLQLKAAFELFFREEATRLEEPGRLRRMSDRALARIGLWVAGHALDEGDEATYQDCLAMSRELNPAIRSDMVWWRLQAKRLIGRRCWLALRPAVYRLRGRSFELPDMPTAG